MEFQPVVLAAGRGSRMTDLTSQVPKALLPIGNMPMLWYPINTLQRAGFEEAIVIVLDSYCAEAQKLLVEICDVKMRLDFVSIPDQDYMGTADSLRYIKDKIKRDILLISCDLIMDISLHHIANIFRTYDATITMLLCSTPEQTSEIPVPGPKSKKRSERDFIGFDEKGNRVLFMTSEADLTDMDDDKIKFRKSLFKKHPNVNIRSNLTDCHLYLMKKWVINYLADNKQISSLKGELIPHLVKKQFARRKKKDIPNTNESIISEDVKSDILSYIPENDMSGVIQDMSTWIDHTGDMEDCFHGDKIRCYAYTVTGGLCVRTNTVATYCETNRQIQRYLMSVNKDMPNVHPSATLKGKQQIGTDCLVGESAVVGEKVSVKRSVVGRHCTVGDKVKIINSVLMDHTHIGEGCSIQGSVIAANAHIGEKCELKDCIVGSGQNIGANSKYTNEALVAEEEMLEF
ncbi:translation initiation factor eIF-2B subunit gamma-like [Ruditapes philippinarum]|uniref:translation initiation factor eIF-2B subunit gamma-like n=1 Tax=Ruditapes philippinarum TaxID=129788 RepID=UPI00295BDF25|nr:translation initiation factor eIF-2B subunit gamma-like [Ruditapes philippinarum]XP_060565447.1 translation initiation factor eIF-2B subunit gamma-like [Ruditapes philippinarum]